MTGTPRSQLEQLAVSIETVGRRLPVARQGRDVGVMVEVVRLDRRIAGPDGAFGQELTPRLVVAYVARARGAMASQPTDACADVRSALALQSSNGDARALLRDCETRARRLLADGQRFERGEPARARQMYGDVVSMLPAGHETAREAIARLSAMGRATTSGPRARPVDEDE